MRSHGHTGSPGLDTVGVCSQIVLGGGAAPGIVGCEATSLASLPGGLQHCLGHFGLFIFIAAH